jgi:hypothetical protein
MRNTTKILILLSISASLPPGALAAAPSSLVALDDAERTYYAQIFTYTMDNVAGGQKFQWNTHSGGGTIAVEEVFISKSGVPCRRYFEQFKVHQVDGALKGVACKRQGDDGWCRLKPTNAYTCAMEDPAYLFTMPSISGPEMTVGPVGNPFDGVNTNPNVNPNINTNVDVEMPKTKEITGQDIAGGVTGNAGKAAGSAVGNSIGWFTKTFLR